MNRTAITERERAAHRIARNVASIEAVPAAVWERLPDGFHNRVFALRWAREGRDVRAEQTVADGRWVLWLDGACVELGPHTSGEPSETSAPRGEEGMRA